MNLDYTPRQQAFRAEVRAWMAAHAPREPPVTLECREGYDQHQAGERTLASGNRGMVTRPEQHGGLGLGLVEAAPIGGFQAIKHQLANCAVAIEFAKPAVWRAASALQARREHAPVHVSHAKLAATDAAIHTAETAIRVHGAMGYTYEVDLHFRMKRSWALAGAWGDRAFHVERIAGAVIGGALPIGPEHTFA